MRGDNIENLYIAELDSSYERREVIGQTVRRDFCPHMALPIRYPRHGQLSTTLSHGETKLRVKLSSAKNYIESIVI